MARIKQKILSGVGGFAIYTSTKCPVGFMFNQTVKECQFVVHAHFFSKLYVHIHIIYVLKELLFPDTQNWHDFIMDADQMLNMLLCFWGKQYTKLTLGTDIVGYL